MPASAPSAQPSPLEPGCYIDSRHGHYAIPAMVRLAVDHGFVLDSFAAYVLSRYERDCHEDTYPTEGLYELAQEAGDWFNSSSDPRFPGISNPGHVKGQNPAPVRPDGCTWGWNDGDFGLYPESDED